MRQTIAISINRLRTALLAVAVLGVASGAARADPSVSAWAPAAKSRVRLLSAGPLENGVYRLGVEIRLEGQALTYWRTPGEAGVPPMFNFSKSTNLAAATVRYPAPSRIDEAGAEAYGYLKEVVFPVEVKPADPAKPVSLDLFLNYASCEKICVPAEGRMQLQLAPDAKPGRHAQRIAQFEGQVPRPVGDADPPVFTIESTTGAAKKGDQKTWAIRIAPMPKADADIFAEGPDGSYFETKRAPDGFSLVMVQKPAVWMQPLRVLLTYRDGQSAIERAIDLDAGPAKP
ncbi:protein-disulfide reductase DsbD family protein [Roseiarcaceae bacterium H3SJ34-1]|uniref:protein-disulfide reductase DsbD domain-containing protein n=1 Tax=Terripilifer ovatus TaxID=3032367 RepID=UPI003AB95307|nr:protein-disulfide reductase DsbD family protein [Roseiarcaceae bacterium H3SJ34-1]